MIDKAVVYRSLGLIVVVRLIAMETINVVHTSASMNR